MIKIKMFGTFLIQKDNRIVDENTLHSEQLERLLTYLLCHRRQGSTYQELFDILWIDSESDNPKGALKNLIYRLRKILREHLGEEPYIQTTRNGYTWNPKIPIEVDAEKFEKSCLLCQQTGLSLREQSILYEQAIQSYTGEFLEKRKEELWVIPLHTYYHSLFLTSTRELLGILKLDRNYEKIIVISAKAIAVDALEEKFHYYLMEGLIQQGQKQLAANHYRNFIKQLRSNLQVSPSPQIRQLYKELIHC